MKEQVNDKEIKTCEHYVINELNEVKEKLNSIASELKYYKDVLDKHGVTVCDADGNHPGSIMVEEKYPISENNFVSRGSALLISNLSNEMAIRGSKRNG